MKRNILLTGLMLLVTLVANAQSFDVDLSRQPQGQPFRYSVKVPDGNYRVSVTIGSRKKAGETAVRAESRRLFFEPQPTKKGQTKTLTFGKKAYIGTNANVLTATSANITGLATSAIKTAKNYGAFTTSADGYIYYAIPDAWGTPTYKDANNLTGTFNKIGTVNVTAHGVTTLYALYRTVYQIPASTTINIQ